MNVIALTLLISLLLACLFLCFFLFLHRRNAGSPEQDALLPLRDDDPKPGKNSRPKSL